MDSRSSRSIEPWKDLAYGPGVWNLKHPSKRECSAQILSYIDWNANFCSTQGRSIGHGSHSPWRRNCPLGTTRVIENLNCEHMTTQSLPQHHHNITERPNCIPHNVVTSQHFIQGHLHGTICIVTSFRFQVIKIRSTWDLLISSSTISRSSAWIEAKIMLPLRSHGCLRFLPYAKHMPPCTSEIYQKRIFYIVPQKDRCVILHHPRSLATVF